MLGAKNQRLQARGERQTAFPSVQFPRSRSYLDTLSIFQISPPNVTTKAVSPKNSSEVG